MDPIEADGALEAGRFARSSSRVFSFVIVGTAYVLAATLLFWILSLPAAVQVAPLSLMARTLVADLAATVLVFAVSLLFDNSSVYDPYWSVFPPLIYLAWITSGSNNLTLRAALVLVLAWLWGTRLTANWVVGWSGLQDEDWRYRDFRAKTGPAYWIVSLFAIHLFPTLAVFAGSLPLYFVLALPGAPLSILDFVAVLVTLSAIVIEGTADAQMKLFKRIRTGGVMVEGLWKYCRHPNYLGEMSFWLGMLLFGLAGGAPLWTAAGMIVMIGIFFGFSMPMLEKKILRTRPEYRDVQRTVSLIIPRPPRR
ncbi:MAG TPA: DUF1295 domain-containing protein [Spirochaetia bacterium]|nr:DUF1295 domain-containing protein [Spirochaetia bacterium]